MANRGKMRSSLKRGRRRNPNTVSNASKPKVRLNFDGQILNGTQFLAPLVTVANTAGALYPIDTSTTTINVGGTFIQGINTGLSSISGIYNEYIYRSVTFHWMPFVSPGIADAGSQIYVGYIDNAEEMGILTALSTSTIFNVSKTLRNMKFFNAWEWFSFTVPLTSRRKSFDVNTTVTLGATDTYDRSMQGMVVVGANSLSATVSLGQWRVTYGLELRRLNTSQTT
jgi:hypothetical protein